SARTRHRLFDCPSHSVLRAHQFRCRHGSAAISSDYAGLSSSASFGPAQPEEFRHHVHSLGQDVWQLLESSYGCRGRAPGPSRAIRCKEDGQDVGWILENLSQSRSKRRNSSQRVTVGSKPTRRSKSKCRPKTSYLRTAPGNTCPDLSVRNGGKELPPKLKVS